MTFVWLEHFHINKYVRKYDGRSEALSPLLLPPRQEAYEIGTKVRIWATGRKKFNNVQKDQQGRYGVIIASSKVPTSSTTPSGWIHHVDMPGSNQKKWFSQDLLRIIPIGLDNPENDVKATI